MAYALGIDVGTTFTSAAIVRDDGTMELIKLGGRAASMPSVVLAREDGELLFGDAAESRSRIDPSRVAREFKRRLGDPTPLVLGGTPYSAQVLTSLLLAHVYGEVLRRMDASPATVVVTHPASYSEYRRDALTTAATEAGIPNVALLTEPEAAAAEYAARHDGPVGEIVAVYDFGGGTFDVALLRRTSTSFELIGTPTGVENLGGSDFDVAVFEHIDDLLDGQLHALDTSDPATLAGLSQLRRDCRDAKETLSADMDVTIPVLVPGLSRQIRLTRSDFEQLIGPRIPETFRALRRAAESAGIDVSAVDRLVLVGGSSQIPLIRTRIMTETGRPFAENIDPDQAVAVGAARRAAQRAAASSSAAGAAALAAAAATAVVIDPPPTPRPVEPPRPAAVPPPPPPPSRPPAATPVAPSTPTPPVAPAPPTGPTPPAAKPGGRRMALVIGAAVVVVAVIVAIIVLATRGDSSTADDTVVTEVNTDAPTTTERTTSTDTPTTIASVAVPTAAELSDALLRPADMPVRAGVDWKASTSDSPDNENTFTFCKSGRSAATSAQQFVADFDQPNDYVTQELYAYNTVQQATTEMARVAAVLTDCPTSFDHDSANGAVDHFERTEITGLTPGGCDEVFGWDEVDTPTTPPTTGPPDFTPSLYSTVAVRCGQVMMLLTSEFDPASTPADRVAVLQGLVDTATARVLPLPAAAG